MIVLCEQESKDFKVEEDMTLDYVIDTGVRGSLKLANNGIETILANPRIIYSEFPRYEDLTPAWKGIIMLDLAKMK